MDLVAIVALKTAVEVEAPLLAANLGATAYETALMLRAPSPIVVLRTDDRGKAIAVLGALRARGHEVVACELSAIAMGGALAQVRSFALGTDGISVATLEGAGVQVAWPAIAALVRAVHRVRSETTEVSSTQKFDLGRAAMTGGIMVTKKHAVTTKSSIDEREPVLYAFRHDGPPLLFRQSKVRWDGLGAQLRPLAHENFTTLVRLLREAAPRAPFDDRLAGPRPVDYRERAGPNGSVSSSTSDGVDQLAHVVATAISRASPYRM